MAMTYITTVSKPPTRIKSMKRYLPGPYTIRQAGSRGVMKEVLAAIAIIIANVRGFNPN